MTMREMIEDYAAAVERGDVIVPPEYIRRCGRLRQRGLSPKLTQTLGETGSAVLLRAMESYSDDELLSISRAAGMGAQGA